MDVDTMPAGRQMDALVGKEVGLDVEPSSNYDCFYGDLISIGDGEFLDPQGWVCDKGNALLPCFSTDIAAAWQVVKLLQNSKLDLGIFSAVYKGVVDYYVEFTHDVPYDEANTPFIDSPLPETIGDAYADTAPLAICRAGMKALRRLKHRWLIGGKTRASSKT